MASLEQLLADLTSGQDARAEAAVPALTVHGHSAVQRLIELSASPIADYRWWAIRALAAFPHAEAQDQMTASLTDNDSSVRQCAALALKFQPSPSATDQLIEQLASEDQLLARLASDALAAIGSAAVPQLSLAAKHEDPQIRIQAVRALALMEAPEAIAPLFKSIDDPSSMVNYWAEEGLDRLGIGMVFFNPS